MPTANAVAIFLIEPRRRAAPTSIVDPVIPCGRPLGPELLEAVHTRPGHRGFLRVGRRWLNTGAEHDARSGSTSKSGTTSPWVRWLRPRTVSVTVREAEAGREWTGRQVQVQEREPRRQLPPRAPAGCATGTRSRPAGRNSPRRDPVGWSTARPRAHLCDPSTLVSREPLELDAVDYGQATLHGFEDLRLVFGVDVAEAGLGRALVRIQGGEREDLDLDLPPWRGPPTRATRRVRGLATFLALLVLGWG